VAAIKPIQAIVDQWRRVAPTRREDYTQGVQAPRRPWAEAAAAADNTWKEGVSKAITEGRYRAGVAAAGNAKWQKNATAKGPNRWSEGIELSGDDYQRGFAPYAQVISGLTLPPRYPRGDARNIERVKAVAAALNDRRRQAKK
jgi:hypothetical protein